MICDVCEITSADCCSRGAISRSVTGICTISTSEDRISTSQGGICTIFPPEGTISISAGGISLPEVHFSTRAMKNAQEHEQAMADAEMGHPAWISSPRISFSTDFAQLGREESGGIGGGGRPSTEFEFCMTIESPVHGSPADDIFFDGKLLPLQISRIQVDARLTEDSRKREAGSTMVVDVDKAEAGPASTTEDVGTAGAATEDEPWSPRVQPWSPSTPTCTGSWKDLFVRRFPGLKVSSFRGGAGLKRLFFKRAAASSSSGEFVNDRSGDVNSGSEEEAVVSTSAIDVEKSSISSGAGAGAALEHAAEDDAEMAVRSEDSSDTNSPRCVPRANSGRILLKNLERCSKNRTATSGKSGGGDKASSFSSSVRVAPVLSVPLCMDTVRETKVGGLRKLLIGKRGFCL